MEGQTLKEKARVVGSFVAGRIAYLQAGLFGEGPGASQARASLAKLRRLGTAADGGWMSVGDQLFEGWPEDKLGQPLLWDGRPTRELLAVQAALRLYALHQQSQKQAMAIDGRRAQPGAYNGAFGWACRRIEPDRTTPGGVQTRLSSIEGAVDYDGILYQVRGLVALLRSKGVALDYYTFASDLYLLQFDAARDAVLARWAKDFYLGHRADQDSEGQPAVE